MEKWMDGKWIEWMWMWKVESGCGLSGCGGWRGSGSHTITYPKPGASIQWGMVRDAPWRKWGGFVMIMMLLLVSIIIYYYMNTFITLHQCTFKHVNITHGVIL